MAETTCDQMQLMSKNIYIPKDIKESIEQLPSIIKRCIFYNDPIRLMLKIGNILEKTLL